MAPLILASASPRRKDLLREHGYEFRVIPADVLEIAPTHLTPGEVTLRNARAKACAVASLHPNEVVMGADTVVVFEGEIFGKPSDHDAAFAMAKRLNGRAHEVYSGVWLRQAATNRDRGFVEITRVQFHRLSEAQLRAYLARIGPLDKAGAYAAQEDRGEFIARVEGSFTNVVGLPMEALAEALKEFGETGERRAESGKERSESGNRKEVCAGNKKAASLRPESGDRKEVRNGNKKAGGAPPAF